ncbi:hypothetical protein [Dactylosporangium darangshiense]|uniref:hypothetical protein n=1 Tax=Dactylosporangium darangshiense TaxID=579108 RepID=UPI0031F003A9
MRVGLCPGALGGGERQDHILALAKARSARGGRISTLHPLPRLDEIVVDVDDTTHAR